MRVRSTRERAARYFLPRLAMLPLLVGHLHAHGAGGALHHAHGGLDVGGVQVLHLHFGDAAHLLASEAPHLVPFGVGRARLDTQLLLDQVGDGRGLEDEGEGAVLVDGDLHRHYAAGLGGGALVVFLDEGHDVDAVLAQGGPHGRGGRGLARLQLQLDYRTHLLGHSSSPRPDSTSG